MQQTILPTTKPIKIPGPDHPITIERNPLRVTVTVAGPSRQARIFWSSVFPSLNGPRGHEAQVLSAG
jgi:hypothetical protein